MSGVRLSNKIYYALPGAVLFEIDRVDFDQREVTLAFLGRTNLAGDRIASAQIETANLRRRDVNVVGTGKIVVLGGAQEAETIRQTFEHAFREDQSAFLGLSLQDLENQFLFAKTGCIEHAHFFRDGVEIKNAFVFEFHQIERWAGLLALLLLLAALFAGMQLALRVRMMARRLANLHDRLDCRQRC